MTRDQFLRLFFWTGLALLVLIVGIGAFQWFKQNDNRLKQYGGHLDPLQRGAIVERIRKYENLIKEDPSNSDHWLQLAFAREQLGDAKGAIAAYERSATLSPHSFLAFESLGHLYRSNGNYEQAEISYYTALKNDPIKPQLYRPLVELYSQYLQLKKEKIPELLNAGLALEPLKEHPELLGLLAVYYKNEGERENAIRAYERLVKADPGNLTASRELDELRGMAR